MRIDEFIEQIREGLIIALFQKLPTRNEHLFRITGQLFTQKVNITLPGDVKRVGICTCECIADRRERERQATEGTDKQMGKCHSEIYCSMLLGRMLRFSGNSSSSRAALGRARA